MQNIFQLPGDGKATTPRPPPDPAPTSLSKADCNSFWTPENRNCTSLWDTSTFPDPTNLKFWTKNRKLEETGEKKEKRWLFDLSLLQLCWKKNFHYFHGSLFMFSRIFAPVRASLLRFSDSIVLPVVDTPPTGSASARFSKHCGGHPHYLHSKNKQILYISVICFDQTGLDFFKLIITQDDCIYGALASFFEENISFASFGTTFLSWQTSHWVVLRFRNLSSLGGGIETGRWHTSQTWTYLTYLGQPNPSPTFSLATCIWDMPIVLSECRKL